MFPTVYPTTVFPTVPFLFDATLLWLCGGLSSFCCLSSLRACSYDTDGNGQFSTDEVAVMFNDLENEKGTVKNMGVSAQPRFAVLSNDDETTAPTQTALLPRIIMCCCISRHELENSERNCNSCALISRSTHVHSPTSATASWPFPLSPTVHPPSRSVESSASWSASSSSSA